MAVQRIQIANNKRINAVKIQKKKISELLADHKDEKARIQVEHIIRDDFTIEGYEVLELMCELVYERIRQITTSSKDPPEELKEAIASLIWAAKNVDIEEMRNVRQQLKQKYTPEFVKLSETNENNLVNSRLYAKLTYKPPSQYLVIKYLEEIARAYNVDWSPSTLLLNEAAAQAGEGKDGDGKDGSGAGGGGALEASKDAPFATPSGASIPMAPASGFASAYAPTLVQQPTVSSPANVSHPALDASHLSVGVNTMLVTAATRIDTGRRTRTGRSESFATSGSIVFGASARGGREAGDAVRCR